jgi:hypothetical protein
MYRGVIIYAPAEHVMEQFVRRMAQAFDAGRFTVETMPADQAAIPALTAADVFLLASLPSSQQPIHPAFQEILRALRGISLAGRVAGAFSVDSEPTVTAFRRALQDCELELRTGNFRNLSAEDLYSPELSDWIDSLTRQLGEIARGR